MSVRLFVTGFGVFHNVTDNPSARLVRWIKHQHGQGCLSTGSSCCGVDVEVLEVSTAAVDAWMDALRMRLISEAEEGVRIVLVHFGVDTTRQQFNLECRAANEAHFRVADERGYQPQHQCIDASDGMTTDCCLWSPLDLQRLQAALQQRGHPVEVSHNAGRFVCNYTLYRSLQLLQQAQLGDHFSSLFVHVPRFSDVPEERQQQFVADFLQELCQLVSMDCTTKCCNPRYSS